jgi:hypothetical protein
MISKNLLSVFALAAASVVPLRAEAGEPAAPKAQMAKTTVQEIKPFQDVFRGDALRSDDIKTMSDVKAMRSDSLLKRKGGSRDVPEFSGGAAGAGLALALGGLLVLSGRRKRRDVA